MATQYMTFLIDAGGVIPGSISKTPDPRQPDELDVFKVICTGRRVTVIGRDQERTTRVFASARWRAGQLDRRTLSKGAPPLTADQWTMIRNSVAEHVDHVAPDKLLPEPARAVREVVSRSPLKLEQPTPLFKAMVWGTMGALTLVVFVLQYTCSANEQPTIAAAPAPAPARVTPPSSPPPEETVAVRIMKAESFTTAFALARPGMTSHAHAMSPGEELFATYAASRLRWEDVDVAAETTYGHVLKDVDQELGKRMCADGEVVAIQRHDLGPRKLHRGSLRVSAADTIAFTAVGTTGELIRGSKARFCGLVTGASGAGVSMIGLFDLTENRAPILEQ